MKTIYSGDIFEKMTVIQSHPDGFRPSEGLFTEHMNIPEYKGFSAKEERIITGGFMIIYQELSNTCPIAMEVIHDFPFLTMIFEFEGYADFQSSKPGMLYHYIPGGMQRLMFFPQVIGKLSYAKSRKAIEITLSLEFFNSLFDNDIESIGPFGRSVALNESVLLTEHPLPITPEMRMALDDIVACKFSGHLKRVYLQSKVAELLTLQLEQLRTKDLIAPIKKLDRDKIYYVKHVIEENLDKPFNIPELAKMAGLNSSKLKQLFKQEFGQTIFGMLTDLRLQQALKLLKEDDLPVGDIAFRSGYKHQQHFTVAFKRKFGYLPSEVRKG